jgi:glycosyltransferase involved in cell wall biosynthesis
MKVFFIRSGNNGQDPISTLQGRSLEKAGVEVHYFDIVGKGIRGYLQNLFRFRKLVKSLKVDLIHAHYSFSGFLAVLSSTGKPVITSLMGSDVKSDRKYRVLIYLFNYLFWKKTIVKSVDMQRELGLKNVEVIPNGVDLDVFYEMNKRDARNKLNLSADERVVLFAADPNRPEKNFTLAQEAIVLAGINIKTMYLKGLQPDEVRDYYNASDVVLLTSLWEGSPNVVKEAMASNRPVITTDVGDVSWLIGETAGCFVTGHNASEISSNIKHCLDHVDKSKGRDRIKSLKLDSVSVSVRILEIYRSVLA